MRHSNKKVSTGYRMSNAVNTASQKRSADHEGKGKCLFRLLSKAWKSLLLLFQFSHSLDNCLVHKKRMFSAKLYNIIESRQYQICINFFSLGRFRGMRAKEYVYKTKTSVFSWMRDKQNQIFSCPASAIFFYIIAKYAFQN